MNAAIAQHLNIAESMIASVEEWAHVLFVRFVSGRPRFVSKKVKSAVNTNNLLTIGSEWKKGDKHRIYFNSLATWYGLKTSHYKSGSVCCATLNGEKVSNSEAKRIVQKFSYVKIWFDVATQKFAYQYDEAHGASTEMINTVIKSIKKAAE